jgi:hypothetical protein
VLVDVVGNLARVELDVIGHGGELCRSARSAGARKRIYLRRLEIQSHRRTLWAGEKRSTKMLVVDVEM